MIRLDFDWRFSFSIIWVLVLPIQIIFISNFLFFQLNYSFNKWLWKNNWIRRNFHLSISTFCFALFFIALRFILFCSRWNNSKKHRKRKKSQTILNLSKLFSKTCNWWFCRNKCIYTCANKSLVAVKSWCTSLYWWSVFIRRKCVSDWFFR